MSFPRFIKTFRLLPVLVALLLANLRANAQAAPGQAFSSLPNHPRILLLEGEEAAIREMVAPAGAWQQLHRAILAECEVLNGLPPIERVQVGRRLLAKSRECLRRVFYLSYAYRVTGEAAFSDWNPSHFLDVAEMTMGMAIGYDWLHAGLSDTAKVRIREAILRKGIQPSLDERYNGWLKASHNWNQVCNAGMAYGALAVYEDQPDGAYPEGYSYWGYGTSFHVLFNGALEKLPGAKAGLPENDGFYKTAGYLLHMTGPTGDNFNYSDAHAGIAGTGPQSPV